MSDNTDGKSTNTPNITEINDPKQLTTVYKKNGSFDQRRKLLLEDFKKSETHSNLLLKLKLMVENKIKNDPSILMKNKGKMGALIQGAIINDHMQQKSVNSKNDNSLLSIVDKDIQEKIIDSPEFHKELKDELKNTKRILLGISDEEYAKQLEEEQRQRELELEEMKKQDTERELAYKNNFKVKNLSANHKVTKAPRFNFSSNRNSERHFRDNYQSPTNETSNNSNKNNANNSNTTNTNTNNNNSAGEDNKQKQNVLYLMY